MDPARWRARPVGSDHINHGDAPQPASAAIPDLGVVASADSDQEPLVCPCREYWQAARGTHIAVTAEPPGLGTLLGGVNVLAVDPSRVLRLGHATASAALSARAELIGR